MREIFLQIVFVSFTIIEGLAHYSEGFHFNKAAATWLGGHRADQKRKTPWRHGGQELLSHWRSPYYDLVDNYYVETLSPAWNAVQGRQLEQLTGLNVEVDALLAFKLGVTKDPLGVLSSWSSNDSDPCQWKGVTCNQAPKHVIALDLNDLSLTGTISPSLGALKYLKRVNLSANSFEGEIPTSLLNCSRLIYLALRDNNLGGTIPFQMGELLNLEFLDLSNNLLLGGNIPDSLGNCSYLQVLHLDFTVIIGEIPSTLGQLSRLQSLNLSQTLNSGTIPKSLGNCSALTFLDLGNDYSSVWVAIILNVTSGQPTSGYLSGEPPVELGQLTQLVNFGISGSNTGGIFPSWIANFTKLNGLLLIDSFFTGEIPEFLGTLPLQILGLSGTNFTGTIPGAISNCSNLWFLTIEYNPFLTGAMPEVGMMQDLGNLSFDYNNHTGEIPASISNCSRLRGISLENNPFLDPRPIPLWLASFVNLTALYLSNTNRVGEIPQSLGQIPQLDFLLLFSNNLSGRIPSSLGNCTSLQVLEMSRNSLVGEIPSDIWNLTQLTSLELDVNLLSGTIPEAIDRLSQLQIFGCSENIFSGEIPQQMGNLQNLQTADFSLNEFDGPIQHSIGNCTALSWLDISENKLTGPLPTSLGNLTAFQQLYLSGNQLEGHIPVDLMKCNRLIWLDLSQNLFVGSIPEEIGQLLSLETLDLHQNKFEDTIPSSIGFFQDLVYIDLSFNQFRGAIPGTAIGNMSGTLYSLNMSHNLLSGSLPQELQLLTELVSLNLSNNGFWGSIASGLGFCKSLQSLGLSMNSLSGGIPQTLGQLQSMDFINLSYNHLEGPVPSGGIFSSSSLSITSFLGNSGLCGSFLLKACPVAPPPTTKSHCKGFQCNHAGVALVSVGAVVVAFVLGGIACKLAYNWWLADHPQNFDQHDDLDMGLTLSEEELMTMVTLPENIIGMGGRSTVYKAILRDGMTVAIKVLNSSGRDDDEGGLLARDEVYREVNALSKIRHCNIVKVLGMFSNPRITALFLEYIPNGSLFKQLFEVEECILSWEARLKIAIGVSEGLLYLHSQLEEPIIHRDLKASNVLLDEDLKAKLCDFGISKFVKVVDVGEATASKVHGTMGYIPPEYGTTNRVSTKGDVYNYGVMLLELLARKRSILAESRDNKLGQQTRTHLVNWILEVTKENPLAGIDIMLLTNSCSETSSKDITHREQMKLLLQVGLLCTQNEPHQRPDMINVVAMLRQVQHKGLDLADRPTLEELSAETSDLCIPDHV